MNFILNLGTDPQKPWPASS